MNISAGLVRRDHRSARATPGTLTSGLRPWKPRYTPACLSSYSSIASLNRVSCSGVSEALKSPGVGQGSGQMVSEAREVTAVVLVSCE
jgi:hypothetical protein